MLEIEDLEKILDSIIEGTKERTREKEKKLIQFFEKNKDRLISDLSLINLFIIHRLDNILSEVFDDEIATILINYNFFQYNINFFIEAVEGSCCVADKTRYILRQYVKSRLEDKPFRITKRKEGEFWKTGLWIEDYSPKWKKLIEAMRDFLYGHPNSYLNFINSSPVATNIIKIKGLKGQYYTLRVQYRKRPTKELEKEIIGLEQKIELLLREIQNSPEYCCICYK